MGFGLTFIGYFIAYLVLMAFPPAKLIGYALIIWGCVKLSEYNTRFRNAILPLGFLSLAGVYSVMGTIYDALGVTSIFFEARALTIAAHISEAIDVAFHACLLIAVAGIAKETELPKTAYKAMRNLLIVIAGEIASITALLLPIEKAAAVASYIAVLLRIVWVVLNTVLLANCYKMICPEGDEDMPAHESNIAIIRKMDAVIDKREEEAKQAAADLVRRRRDKKENNNKKKKRK